MEHGNVIRPRGQEVKELEDYQIILDPYERFTNFEARHMSFNYLAAEWAWYLGADPFDTMISDKAQMWRDIQQPDGSFFSNYGQYWFGPQQGVRWVVEELTRDPDSRRAVIPMLNKDHLFAKNKDVVCTEAINFRIRNGALNMTVNMRSNDAVWGMTNDIACFSFLQELVAGILEVPMGRYCHKADSLHVYARHYKMLENILDQGEDGYTEIDCPKMDGDDLAYQYMRKRKLGPFCKWLFQ
jgi:thymidylate synthase